MARQFDDTVGKVGLGTGKPLQSLMHRSMVLDGQFSGIKQSLKTEDKFGLGHTILAAQNPNHLSQRYERNETRRFGRKSSQKLFCPAALF